MNISKLRQKKLDFLNIELLNLLKEQFNLKLQFFSNKLKKTHLLKLNRKKISIIKTIISEKDRSNAR